MDTSLEIMGEVGTKFSDLRSTAEDFIASEVDFECVHEETRQVVAKRLIGMMIYTRLRMIDDKFERPQSISYKMYFTEDPGALRPNQSMPVRTLAVVCEKVPRGFDYDCIFALPEDWESYLAERQLRALQETQETRWAA